MICSDAIEMRFYFPPILKEGAFKLFLHNVYNICIINDSAKVSYNLNVLLKFELNFNISVMLYEFEASNCHGFEEYFIEMNLAPIAPRQ